MQEPVASQTPLVALQGVTKRFGNVVANRAVDMAVGAGEVVALVGENGAGKSTIVNLLTGLFLPDDGTILLEGRPVSFTSATASAAAGIGVVHQHFMLVPTLSALDNIALAMPELGLGRLDRGALRHRIRAVAGRLGFHFDDGMRVDGLDVAHQQRIEIIKALMHDVRLLILDEPTAVLGPDDRQHLFSTIRRLRAEGTSVVLITHKLDDIFAVADRAIVLRNGSVVADAPVPQLTAADVVGHMVGSRDRAELQAIVTGGDIARADPSAGEVICKVRNLALKRSNGSVAVSGVSLDIHAGEIIAVAGVDGNGQSEFVRCLAGMALPDAGFIDCFGESSADGGWTAARLRSLGVAHVPEDRRRSGIIGVMTLARNYLLGHLEGARLTRLGLLRDGVLKRVVGARLKEFQVRCDGPDDRMERLSGGNQQKVVLARELDGEPRLILAAHPSRGLDLKTIRFVHGLLQRARDAGQAVLLLSSDLDEVLQLADRIVVFADGGVFGPANRREVGREEIGAWIAGRARAAA